MKGSQQRRSYLTPVLSPYSQNNEGGLIESTLLQNDLQIVALGDPLDRSYQGQRGGEEATHRSRHRREAKRKVDSLRGRGQQGTGF